MKEEERRKKKEMKKERKKEKKKERNEERKKVTIMHKGKLSDVTHIYSCAYSFECALTLLKTKFA